MIKNVLRTTKHVLIGGFLVFCGSIGVYLGKTLPMETALFVEGLCVGLAVGLLFSSITYRLVRASSPIAPSIPEGFVFVPGQAQVPGWSPEKTKA